MRASVLGCVLALSCGLSSLARPASPAQSLGDSLRRRAVRELAAGKLLIAARNLPDPNFATTVVLLANFNAEGAMGLVINRPTKVTMARLFPELAATAGGASTAFLGGPVPGPGVFALLRSTRSPADGRRVVDEVYLVSSRARLEEMVTAGADRSRFRVYLGYAGWGPGQLEEETSRGVWRILDAEAAIVFDPDPAAVWERQIRRTETVSAN